MDSEILIGFGWLEDAALSPDGCYLASCSDSAIRIWSLTRSIELVLQAEGVPWVSVAWSPGGGMIAGLNALGEFKVFRVVDGYLISQNTYSRTVAWYGWPASPLGPVPFAWSPNGSVIAYGCPKGFVEFFDPYTGKHLGTLHDGRCPTRIEELAWSPDGTLLSAFYPILVEAAWPTIILVHDMIQNNTVYTIDCRHQYEETGMFFLPSNDLVWAGDRNVSIHEQGGRVNKSSYFADPNSRIMTLGGSPDGQWLALGTWWGEIVILDRDLVEVDRTPRTNSSIQSISWEGSRMISIHADQTIRTWGFDRGKIWLGSVLSGWGENVVDVQFYPGGYRILASHIQPDHGPCSVRCYETDGDELFGFSPENSGIVRDADLSANGELIAAVEQDQVTIWDADHGSLLTRLYTRMRCCRWNPVYPYILAVSGLGGVEIWDVTDTTSPVLTISFPGDNSNVVDWSGDGELLAIGTSHDPGRIEVWDINRPAMLTSFETWGWIACVAFSPDGSIIASRSVRHRGEDMPNDCQAWDHLWKVELWRTDQSGGSHADYVDGIYLPTDDASFETYDGLAWSPDSSLLAITTGTAMSRPNPEFADHGCGQSEPGIIIVRPETLGGLSCIANLTGPTRPVTTLDWSPDGEKVVIGCQDGTIRIWTASFGNEGTQIIGNPHEYVVLLPALSVLYCLTRIKHRNKEHQPWPLTGLSTPMKADSHASASSEYGS